LLFFFVRGGTEEELGLFDFCSIHLKKPHRAFNHQCSQI